jgi:hypothetical protein
MLRILREVGNSSSVLEVDYDTKTVELVKLYLNRDWTIEKKENGNG